MQSARSLARLAVIRPARPSASIAVWSAAAPSSSVCLPSSAAAVASFAPRRWFASDAPPKKPSKLVGAALSSAVSTLTGWKHEVAKSKDQLVKSYLFDDFNQAFSVMTRTALLAEKMNHHPKWTNVYNQLKVELETHDVSGISNFDIYMAQQIDAYAAQVKKASLPK